MTNQNLIERSTACLSSVLSHATSLQIKQGKGVYLMDYNRTSYLDFGAGVAVNSTGHCHPRVVSAIQHQATQLLHGCAGVVYYEENIALAEQLGAISGPPLDSVFFTQSGTEAVEAALKCATYVRNCSQIIAFNGSFHGRTLGALSVTTSNKKYQDRYSLAYKHPVVLEYPYFYRNGSPLNTEEGYLNYLSDALSNIDASSVAAVIIEPFIGEGGYIPAPGSVLRLLREWCSSTGVLLIFDEIQSGIGRTGEWFYFQHFHVVPDILTTAKGIASGLPLGACISSKAIMDQWPTGSHGGTYGGNPLTCAAGSATLSVISPLLPQIKQLGALAIRRLRTELEGHPNIGDIRGEGLMIGIEFVKTNSGVPGPELVKKMMDDCLNQCLIILSCGIHRNVVRLMPPLVISEDELHKGLDIFISICRQL
jgi:4-aminobutyrate aminotransferase